MSPLLYPLLMDKEIFSHHEFEKEINKLEIQAIDSLYMDRYTRSQKDWIDYYSLIDYLRKESPDAEVFYFDPNTASFADGQKLRINEKTIHIIQYYFSEGDKFYKAENISKIWGCRRQT
jgi:hypothetical protein